MRVIPVSQYQGGMLLIWTRLSGRPALKRAYWSFFLWADGRWPAHLRPHLFLCRQLQGALLVSHWSLAVPHFNSQPLTLPTSGRGGGSKSAQSCLWCLCVVTIWHAGGYATSHWPSHWWPLLVQSLMRYCVSVLKTTQYWENYTFNILTIYICNGVYCSGVWETQRRRCTVHRGSGVTVQSVLANISAG